MYIRISVIRMSGCCVTASAYNEEVSILQVIYGKMLEDGIEDLHIAMVSESRIL